MVTPQFIAAGKKNLEKCPTRHGKKNPKAGRPKSLLKGLISENHIGLDDAKKLFAWMLFDMSIKDLEKLLENHDDTIPAFVYICVRKILDDVQGGRIKTLNEMLAFLYKEYPQNSKSKNESKSPDNLEKK